MFRFRPSKGHWGTVEKVNPDRRCLVIDPQPTVRLGVRRLLDPRYVIEEAGTGMYYI